MNADDPGQGGTLEKRAVLEGACHCGGVRWRFQGKLASATACNCTVCRRYGVLWGYGFEAEGFEAEGFEAEGFEAEGFEAEGVEVSGTTTAYVWGHQTLGFHFCPQCGCIAYWRSLQTREDGRRRIGVNLRLAEPDAVATLPIHHFDGLVTFKALARDGRCVTDVWF